MSTHLRRGPAESTDALPVAVPDLIAYFADGAKPRECWRVGVEFEKFALDRGTGRQIGFDDGIEAILERLAARFHWEPHREAGRLTTLTRGHSTLSVEPGGQLELSTAPATHISELEAELNRHLEELRAVAEARTVAWVAAGVTPFSAIEEIPLNPRPRHRFMAQYLPRRCRYGLHMMKATASTQVTFDYADEADAGRKFAAALRLGPIVNALVANAPFEAGTSTGFASFRSEIWHGMDPDRSGLLTDLLDGDLTFARWVDRVLDVPLLFIDVEGALVPVEGLTFRQWMERGLDDRWPTLADWELHLSTVFTEVRLKRYLEVRGADATPAALALAVPAVWKGLLYDRESLGAATELARNFPPEELETLSRAVARQGLRASQRGRRVAEWSAEAVAIAAQGLSRLARATGRSDESHYLDPLGEVLETGHTPGDRWASTTTVREVLAHCEYR